MGTLTNLGRIGLNIGTTKLGALLVATLLGAGAVIATPAEVSANTFACADPGNLCIDPGSGAKWESGKQTAAKDKKKRSDKSAGSMSVSVEGGRGSVFINGRYAGTAPLSGVPIPSGRNDVQVRDGATVLSQGVMTVPKGATLSVSVRHP